MKDFCLVDIEDSEDDHLIEETEDYQIFQISEACNSNVGIHGYGVLKNGAYWVKYGEIDLTLSREELEAITETQLQEARRFAKGESPNQLLLFEVNP